MSRGILLVLGVVLFIGFLSLPPEPEYGPYSRFDLISFIDYKNVPVPQIVTNNLETLRMVNQLGLKGAMDAVAHDAAYEFNDSACHGAAHVVGRMAFNLMGAQVLQACTTQCFSGCYHGALQGMGARSAGSAEALATDIYARCSELPTVFERSECMHGAGHGFLLYTRYELDEALSACALFGNEQDIYECDAGVFMENLIGDGSEARFMSDDLHYPCNRYDDPTIVQACYRLQPGRFVDAYQGDFARAQAECVRAPLYAQDMCFMRLGQLSGVDMPDAAAHTEAFCRTVPEDFYDDCILGGLRQVIRVHGIDPTGTAASFCKALEAPDAKHICYAQYAREIPDLFTDVGIQTQLCSLFEEPYQVWCKR